MSRNQNSKPDTTKSDALYKAGGYSQEKRPFKIGEEGIHIDRFNKSRLNRAFFKERTERTGLWKPGIHSAIGVQSNFYINDKNELKQANRRGLVGNLINPLNTISYLKRSFTDNLKVVRNPDQDEEATLLQRGYNFGKEAVINTFGFSLGIASSITIFSAISAQSSSAFALNTIYSNIFSAFTAGSAGAAPIATVFGGIFGVLGVVGLMVAVTMLAALVTNLSLIATRTSYNGLEALLSNSKDFSLDPSTPAIMQNLISEKLTQHKDEIVSSRKVGEIVNSLNQKINDNITKLDQKQKAGNPILPKQGLNVLFTNFLAMNNMQLKQNEDATALDDADSPQIQKILSDDSVRQDQNLPTKMRIDFANKALLSFEVLVERQLNKYNAKELSDAYKLMFAIHTSLTETTDLESIAENSDLAEKLQKKMDNILEAVSNRRDPVLSDEFYAFMLVEQEMKNLTLNSFNPRATTNEIQGIICPENAQDQNKFKLILDQNIDNTVNFFRYNQIFNESENDLQFGNENRFRQFQKEFLPVDKTDQKLDDLIDKIGIIDQTRKEKRQQKNIKSILSDDQKTSTLTEQDKRAAQKFKIKAAAGNAETAFTYQGANGEKDKVLLSKLLKAGAKHEIEKGLLKDMTEDLENLVYSGKETSSNSSKLISILGSEINESKAQAAEIKRLEKEKKHITDKVDNLLAESLLGCNDIYGLIKMYQNRTFDYTDFEEVIQGTLRPMNLFETGFQELNQQFDTDREDWLRRNSDKSNKDYLKKIHQDLSPVSSAGGGISSGSTIPANPYVFLDDDGYLTIDNSFLKMVIQDRPRGTNSMRGGPRSQNVKKDICEVYTPEIHKQKEVLKYILRNYNQLSDAYNLTIISDNIKNELTIDLDPTDPNFEDKFEQKLEEKIFAVINDVDTKLQNQTISDTRELTKLYNGLATVLVGKENFQEQLAQGNDAFKSVFEAQLESYVDLADKKRDDIESKRQDIKKYKDLLSSNQTNMLEKAQKELARPGSELYKTYADNYVQEEELIVKLHNGGNNLFIRLKEELQKVFEKLVVGEQPGYYDKLVIGYLSEFKNESRSASRGGSVSSVSSGSDLYNSANGSYNFGSKVTVGDILNRDGIAAYFEIMSSDPSNGAVLNSEAYDKAFFGLEHRAQEVVKEFTSGEISKHTDKIRLGDDNHLATVYTSDVDGQPVRQIGGDRDQWLQKEFKTSVVDYLSIGDDGQVNSHAASHSARVSSRNSGPASR